MQTSQLGLLSKLEQAGFSLSTAKPLLVLADELDLLGILDAQSDKVLPLAAKAIDLAPSLLPLASTALNTPPAALFGGAAGSLAAAAALVAVVPDDSVASIAVQTFLAITLGAVLPGALGVGGFILSKIGGGARVIAGPKVSAVTAKAPSAPKLVQEAPRVSAPPKAVVRIPVSAVKIAKPTPVVAPIAPKVAAAAKVTVPEPKVVSKVETPKAIVAAPKPTPAPKPVAAAKAPVVAVAKAPVVAAPKSASGGALNGKRKTIKI